MPYDHITIHKTMLNDQVRTRAFERAIRETVRPGHRVLDFGCGTGILSFFAARQGARTVYAVDQSGFIRAAQNIAKDNELENIVFIHGDENDIQLPEKVDVIVSEFMGHFLFWERMLESVIKMRNRYLEKGGIMIPEQVTLHAGLVSDESLYWNLSYFRTRPYGFDFSSVADWPFYHTELVTLKSGQILPMTARLGEIDLATCKEPPSTFSGMAVSDRRATVYGLCGWFSARLSERVTLGTGPADPETHWSQVFFPFLSPLEIPEGTEVHIEIVQQPDRDGKSTLWRWTVKAGDRKVEMDNFLHSAWIKNKLPRGPLR
jgi:SAM-dependent methyltransferase